MEFKYNSECSDKYGICFCSGEYRVFAHSQDKVNWTAYFKGGFIGKDAEYASFAEAVAVCEKHAKEKAAAEVIAKSITDAERLVWVAGFFNWSRQDIDEQIVKERLAK
jgi:hypothetical protein